MIIKEIETNNYVILKLYDSNLIRFLNNFNNDFLNKLLYDFLDYFIKFLDSNQFKFLITELDKKLSYYQCPRYFTINNYNPNLINIYKIIINFLSKYNDEYRESFFINYKLNILDFNYELKEFEKSLDEKELNLIGYKYNKVIDSDKFELYEIKNLNLINIPNTYDFGIYFE